MTVELRPLGVTCNLACHYCYQNPQSDAGNERVSYDMDKMKAAAKRIGGPFTLFGGEPLMIRFEDLEHLFAWGLESFGSNAIQTNGVLIESRHIDLFRGYKVSVGISIDGPGELNDARWHRGLEKTRRSTALVQLAIGRLCREYEAPGLIVTLHKGNATQAKLPIMFDWFRELDAMGIKAVRLHLLEVDHQSVRDSLALSARENIEALLAFAEFEQSLSGIRFDLFKEMEQLLDGNDGDAGCTWRACDPYTTHAVQGVEGDGQASNCGRTNKEGIGFIKAETAGYERYLALFRTPQSENGCAGCRFFLMCKGQCPGTAVDGDWRNRTEHCQEWMHLFASLEKRMIVSGKIPLTIQPLRFDLEQRQIKHWERGENPLMRWIVSLLHKERVGGTDPSASAAPADNKVLAPALKPRISWVGETARDIWQVRFLRVQSMLEDMTVWAAQANARRCAARLVPDASIPRLLGLATGLALATSILPEQALPGGVCTQPGEGRAVAFLAGGKGIIACAEAAFASEDRAALLATLNLPDCCMRHAVRLDSTTTISAAIWALAPTHLETLILPETIASHHLLAPLGLSILPALSCKVDCSAAQDAAERWLELATAHGYATEVGWLRECLSWAIAWSELHGVTEIKTPVFKLALQTKSNTGPRHILRSGSTTTEGAIAGLRFPYATPLKRGRDSHLRLAL